MPTPTTQLRSHAAVTSLRILAILATIVFVQAARVVLLPTVLALLAFFVLSPLVRGLRRRGVPSSIGAALVLATAFGSFTTIVVSLGPTAVEWIEEAPSSLLDVRRDLEDLLEPVEEVTKATEDIANIRQDENATLVEVKGSSVLEDVLSGTGELAIAIFLSSVLLFFLLAREDQFHEIVDSLVRRSRSENGLTTAVEFQQEISRYLLTITCINVGLGVVVGLGMYLLGLPSPVLWGIGVALLNYVPYLGPTAGIIGIGFASFVAFDTVEARLLPPLLYLVLNAVEAMVVTPMVLGQSFRLSPFAVFVWLMLWTWIWGIPGALIAVPLLAILKILSRRGLRSDVLDRVFSV